MNGYPQTYPVAETVTGPAPPVLDPFCGGGSIPLEAQRLGLRAYGSDLNPVPVLITKALIEIPPKFASKPPVNPESNARLKDGWKGAQGLAEDVRYYGKWMRDEAEKRIGHLYPKIKITEEMVWGSKWGSGVSPDSGERRPGRPTPSQSDFNCRPGWPTPKRLPIRPDLEPYLGQELTVIAWIWARTVASPNPAVGGAHVPLVRSFWLSTKKGKEAWVEPIIDRENNSYRFEVRVGKPSEGFDPGIGTIGRKGGRCALSDSPMPFTHVRAEGKAGRMSQRLMAIVAEGTRGRVYLSPLESHVGAAESATPTWRPDCQLPVKHRNFQTPAYGMPNIGDLFTPRQLTALTTFSDLVKEAREKVLADARVGGRASCPTVNAEIVGQDGRPPTSQTLEVDVGRDARPPEGRPPEGPPPKGFYRRGEKHPPHFDQPGKLQHVTFRLAGSLPAEYLARAKQELASGQITSEQYREKLEAELDRGHGPGWLGEPAIADVIQAALEHFDGERYHLHTWCIMPNHVHVLFVPQEGQRLANILHSWKSFTAKECNQLLGRSGPFWQDDYFDRYMRDQTDVQKTSMYIMNNGGRASCPTSNVGLEGRPPSGPTLDQKWGWASCQTEAIGGRDARPPEGRHPGDQPPWDSRGIDQGGTGPQAYADAVATYLAFAVDKSADYWCTVATWSSSAEFIRGCFARQALPMTWDYCECNPLSTSTANWSAAVEWTALALLQLPASAAAHVIQSSAAAERQNEPSLLISTDPPYYDNIGYADLSDFFYVWLRRSLGDIYPDLFKTLLTPKADELISSPYRHGGSKQKAQQFFEQGLGKAFEAMRAAGHADYPLTVFYAFKQSEETAEGDPGGGHPGRQPPTGVGLPARLLTDSESGKMPDPLMPDPQSQAIHISSTGWETMLEGLIRSGFSVDGTWPMRTERGARSIGIGTNALASSIVLSCRPRAIDAPLATRREFLAALKRELPDALRHLQAGNIAPVDLAQAAIGPGMAIFTRYSKVMEADGSSMTVRQALGLINQMLDEVLAEQEGEFDPDTRWAVAWFEQFGMEDGPFGEAETLSRAKNTAVNGLVETGIIAARAGKVRLLKRDELPTTWKRGSAFQADDRRAEGPSPPAHWEVVQHLIRALDTGGEVAAGDMLRRLGSVGEAARDLAYRLYNVCERKKWAAEALAYNSLVIAWPEISKLARGALTPPQTQEEMFK